MLIVYLISRVRRRSVICFVFNYVAILALYRRMEQLVARLAHNQKVTGANPVSATKAMCLIYMHSMLARSYILMTITNWIACLDIHSFPFSCLFVEKCINIWQPDADILCDGRDPTKECEIHGMLCRVTETVNKLNKRYTSQRLAKGYGWWCVMTICINNNSLGVTSGSTDIKECVPPKVAGVRNQRPGILKRSVPVDVQ